MMPGEVNRYSKKTLLIMNDKFRELVKKDDIGGFMHAINIKEIDIRAIAEDYYGGPEFIFYLVIYNAINILNFFFSAFDDFEFSYEFRDFLYDENDRNVAHNLLLEAEVGKSNIESFKLLLKKLPDEAFEEIVEFEDYAWDNFEQRDFLETFEYTLLEAADQFCGRVVVEAVKDEIKRRGV